MDKYDRITLCLYVASVFTVAAILTSFGHLVWTLIY